jgi:hypothetical protein
MDAPNKFALAGSLEELRRTGASLCTVAIHHSPLQKQNLAGWMANTERR